MVQGENAWVFVNEEAIAESVKAYRKFNDKLLEKYPKEKRKDMKPTEITGWTTVVPLTLASSTNYSTKLKYMHQQLLIPPGVFAVS